MVTADAERGDKEQGENYGPKRAIRRDRSVRDVEEVRLEFSIISILSLNNRAFPISFQMDLAKSWGDNRLVRDIAEAVLGP